MQNLGLLANQADYQFNLEARTLESNCVFAQPGPEAVKE
tara:strand:- start:285 stop:401 length:117 start_codon:yes stop_codon:yes gene_type:complete